MGDFAVHDPPASSSSRVTVGALLADPALDLDARVLAGHAGLDRWVDHPRVQKSGLVLVGHVQGLVPTRIQVLGETEMSFAEALAPEAQGAAARHLFSRSVSCVLVTRGEPPPDVFVAEAERTGTPLVLCEQRSSAAITALHTLLDERLAPRSRIHGVLVDVFEVGVLLLGKSGIGKSECALELVMRGHRLVADDVIECDYRPPGMVFGEPADPLRHFIEVRGLGIINVMDLYGVTSVRERKRIDLVVRLEAWSAERSYDRLGVDDHFHEILGVPVRIYTVPVRSGRNMSAIVEIAARLELLKQAGHDPSQALIDRLEEAAGAGEVLEVPRVPARAAPVPPTERVLRQPTPNESAVPPPVVQKGKR